MRLLSQLPAEVRQYLLVTGNYWAFTLTDGALRMLVLLHFHALGYSPLQIAALFLFSGPYVCIAATIVITAILYYRQMLSPTARAIATYVAALKRLGS